MKSFQEILEKRVRNTKKTDFDFYTIEKATKQVCTDIFGEIGEQNIVVKKWEAGQLMLSAEKSLWRSELVLNKKTLATKINNIFKTNAIKKIIIV
jgi:hypothetical protein